MATHARLSPSSSKRWMTCPGSINLVEQLIEEGKIESDTTSKYAAEGTVAHEIHELCLLGNRNADHYLGMKFDADGFDFVVNTDMVEAVQESLDYIRERIEDAEDFGYTVELLVEERSSLQYLGINGLDGGTADAILIIRDGATVVSVEVIDYKHGQGVAVEVEENTQALSYGLGVIRRPEYKGHPIDEGIRLTISQPRAHHPDGSIRSWDISKKELTKWEKKELIPKAKATFEKNALLVPSDDGCRFCNASGQCSALYAKTQEIAIADFKEDSFPNPKIMTSDQKKTVMDHAEMIRAFIVAVENQVKQEVDNGSTDYEESYKLVRKTTHRKFTEEGSDEDFSPLLDYLNDDEVFDRTPKMKALGSIEKVLKKKAGKDKAKEIMDEITDKPEGSLVIAPISDKRKGVQSTLIGDFSNLSDN